MICDRGFSGTDSSLTHVLGSGVGERDSSRCSSWIGVALSSCSTTPRISKTFSSADPMTFLFSSKLELVKHPEDLDLERLRCVLGVLEGLWEILDLERGADALFVVFWTCDLE